MILKYTFGTPFDTEAVVTPVTAAPGTPEPFHLTEDGTFTCHLADRDIIYGLGEQARGINKRGWQYISFNSDDPNHQEDTRSLYGSHNFLILRRETETVGAFFDIPTTLEFDIGYTRRDTLTIRPASMDLDVYIITGETEKDIVKQFRRLIGRSYLPPLWAFGYGQCRWSYMNEDEIREVAERYKAAGVPMDSIYLDIDYMDHYKDFTVSDESFPHLAELAADMKKEGIHLVPIIDAGVKIEEGYDVYEEGVEKNYFCKNAQGNDFVGAVWPGLVHFPDFLNPDARAWFGSKYEALTKLGIDGFWNDMNEPAIFYTPERLARAIKKVAETDASNLGVAEYDAMRAELACLNNHREDYDSFFHNVNGRMVKHGDVHNLFGMNMTRSANEALGKIQPEKRTLFFSRSSYIGAHRYGGIWQGDNKSWWSHILLSMQQLPGLNMAGFLYVGSDIGGFGSDATEDLVQRWLQYALFTPLMRNHAAWGTRRQELYRFSNLPETTELVKIRYCLIPYLYSEFLKALERDEMMFRPLAFDFREDPMAAQVEDQLLLGDQVMIAPIYRQNARGRYVYLPEEMMLIRMRTFEDFDAEILPPGHHYVPAEVNELIFFLRKGRAIPFGKPVACTRDLDASVLDMLGYEGAEYEMFEDDGISQDAVIRVRNIQYM